MKRVLIFSLAYYPHVGGAEVAIKEITDRINDIEFHLVTLRFSSEDAPEERMGNVMVHRIGGDGSYLSKVLFAPRAVRLALRLHAAQPFDAAWAMMSYMLFPVALMRLRGMHLPYVLTLQEGDTYAHMFWRLRILPFLPLITWGFRNAAVVQAISNHLGVWARQRGFRGPLEIIPNGVDTRHFVGSRVAHERTVLITASRLVHKNGLDSVIRALPALLQTTVFRILGSGPDEAALRSLAQRLRVEERVEFVGHIDHADLPRELHTADIFIRPSRSEGMGNAFIEAFAAELPVIATQEGGIADFLFDAKRNPDKPTTGWAVDKDNPEQIAAAVQEIVADPARTATVVARAKALALERYDWALIARQMRGRVFSEVLR